MPSTIENYALPSRLYRFRKVGSDTSADNVDLKRAIESIRRGSCWCGDYKSLNDAMEGLYEVEGDVAANSDWRRASRMIRDGKQGLGIACFSETWDQALMWAHYADSFKGLCIEYDFEALRDSLPDATSFSRISYAGRLLDIGSEIEDTNQIAKWILSTKHESWSYEREWRLFAPTGGNVSFDRRAIRRVILGPRMPQHVAEHIRHHVRLNLVTRTMIEGYKVIIRDAEVF
ncbi:DUF2971 domain-containing protein [Agrobacterium rhizogenes]|nr:DUF2971 domain-containing protein [Rhizobium rhizogenes]